MPPKAKFTKQQIIDTAFCLVQKHGMEMLTARSLAAELETSTAPIFTAFSSIEEVQKAVIERAMALYKTYFNEGLSMTPPFKGTGIKYIEFAKNEPELFKLLFMGSDEDEQASHFFPEKDENLPTVLAAIENSNGISEDRARYLYNHLSVYAHGLAVLYAQRRCVFTMEDVNRMLSEVFFALLGGSNE